MSPSKFCFLLAVICFVLLAFGITPIPMLAVGLACFAAAFLVT